MYTYLVHIYTLVKIIMNYTNILYYGYLYIYICTLVTYYTIYNIHFTDDILL